jgi:transposase
MIERLKIYVTRNPFKTARELKNEVFGWEEISVRRIQEILKDKLKLPSRAAAKKPMLTKAMVKKRLSFCKKYRHWTVDQWRKVMFSDESTFRIVNARGAKVRRPKTVSRYKHRYTIPTVKHSASVMVWACFSGSKGRGGLYFLPKNTTMNGERYLKVLKHHLLPFMKIHKSTWFLQDGAPCHTSKLVMGKLKEMKKQFQVMDWPGNSPDLNPIENCWSYMKYKLKSDRAVTSLPKMILALKMMWIKDMPLEYFRKLCDSMPKRIEEVLANNGHMSKY